MPAPTRATVGLAATLLLAVPVLGACGAGRTAVTATERAAIDGAQTNAGDLQLRNVHFEAPVGGQWDAGSRVGLAMYVVNRSSTADQLLAVTVPGGSAVITPSPLVIPGGGVLTTGSAHTQGATTVPTVLITPTQVLRSGQSLPVQLTFARAGVVTLDVPVALS